MEKKTNIVQFTTTPGKTVLERFKNYIKRNDTSEGMLEILSIENARAIGLNGVEGDSVFEKYAEEYAEFFDYFTSHHMNEEMEDRFMENWEIIHMYFDLLRHAKITSKMNEWKISFAD